MCGCPPIVPFKLCAVTCDSCLICLINFFTCPLRHWFIPKLFTALCIFIHSPFRFYCLVRDVTFYKLFAMLRDNSGYDPNLMKSSPASHCAICKPIFEKTDYLVCYLTRSNKQPN